MSKAATIAGRWFWAAEETGDFMGIRYGHAAPDAETIEWSFVPHAECDGIGGFARLLRQHGAKLTTLPQTSHRNQGYLRPLWKLWRAERQAKTCAQRPDWALHTEQRHGPSSAIAWHLFSEDETTQIQHRCKQQGVSVNSHLLKQLDQAIRPDIHTPGACLPWMVPVNLRGDVAHPDDTANHVSYIIPRIENADTCSDIQQQVRARLGRGEHRANYLLMLNIGKLLSDTTKVKLVIKDRTKPAGNIGAFSNLGVWDAERAIDTDKSWYFCPPVAQGQLLGAGCVTFQGRLSLTLQANPSLSGRPELTDEWMKRWVSNTSEGPDLQL